MMQSADGSQRVRLRNVASLVELIAILKKQGKQVVLVSSGAVGMGLIKLGIKKPTDLRKKQAVAAAGQSKLMRMYEDLFSTVGLQCAQLLLSQSDFLDKTHWKNVKHTIVE
jgi:glutamate 5-kinase